MGGLENHMEEEEMEISWVSAQCITFKVNSAISIYVSLLDHLRNLPGCELLPQQPLHGLLQLCQCDLSVSIGIKLKRSNEARLASVVTTAAGKVRVPGHSLEVKNQTKY